MGKFNGMLLISDYDNTFQYTESALSGGGAEAVPPPPARNLAAAERWISEGGQFAIATGRSLGAFRQHAERIPINAPVIVDNGGGIYDLAGKRYLVRKLLQAFFRQPVFDSGQHVHRDKALLVIRKNQ